ncbi:MAG: anaerobic ribonucleoside-triphosphate reductase activating protein [Clostridia bacterium]|nr:anaerobic ribonucleoside-triphosphate reductase activating protein [Clostridia bacterium]
MHYGTIKNFDVADGPGCRVSLFVSGCRNHCPGCFNRETWDFCFGQEYTEETEQMILQALAPDHIQGLSLLGGDPFEPENQRELVRLLHRVRTAFPKKDIWAYTGYTLEKLQGAEGHPRCEVTDEMLSMIDILVDGPFVEARKNISLRFRGSENQRIIDLPNTLKSGEIVISHYMKRD